MRLLARPPSPDIITQAGLLTVLRRQYACNRSRVEWLESRRRNGVRRQWRELCKTAGLVIGRLDATYFLGTRPIRKNSSFGRIEITFAIRFDSPKKAVIAAISQMSSSLKPCARSAS